MSVRAVVAVNQLYCECPPWMPDGTLTNTFNDEGTLVNGFANDASLTYQFKNDSTLSSTNKRDQTLTSGWGKKGCE
jgi:hypothetical protein